MRSSTSRSGDHQVLNPVGRNALLSFRQRYITRSHSGRQVVLDNVLLLKVPRPKCDIFWSALRPDVAHTISPTQFQRHKVVQLALLRFTTVLLGSCKPVPDVNSVFLVFRTLAVADATRTPARTSQGGSRDTGNDTTRRAPPVRLRIPVPDGCLAASICGPLPRSKVLRRTNETKTGTAAILTCMALCWIPAVNVYTTVFIVLPVPA